MKSMHIESVSMDADLARPGLSHADVIKAERKKDERSFHLLFVLSFPLFLVAVMLGRLIPGISALGEGSSAHRDTSKSIIAEASATARSTIAIALTS